MSWNLLWTWSTMVEWSTLAGYRQTGTRTCSAPQSDGACSLWELLTYFQNSFQTSARLRKDCLGYLTEESAPLPPWHLVELDTNWNIFQWAWRASRHWREERALAEVEDCFNFICSAWIHRNLLLSKLLTALKCKAVLWCMFCINQSI